MNQYASETVDESSIVELRIPPEAEWAAVARLTVAAIASRLDFSLDDIDDVKLAVAEACTHAIQRATGEHPIELVFEARADSIVVTVRDSSTAAHLESVEDDVDENHIGGLGLFIIRSLMDEVDFRVDPRVGGELTMLKRVTG
ncbi:MAG TPA: ATP-binding protein [Candidatus Acidoferrales bacterium]|jgi:serine/threonine-protein kinase RsbW|nr:ATP-binding protein [Candidatus Acidoferrales bacterium]